MSATKQTTRKYPAPLYAAAGAGDIAYRTLRTLPAKLRNRDINVDVDVDRLRAAARRNAAAFRASAQAVQDKAVEIYTDLVARGEKVVAGGARTAEATVVEIADHAEKDAAITAKATRPAKAVKSTRPAATNK
jgi:heparin binding hemagglutinin HbhA